MDGNPEPSTSPPATDTNEEWSFYPLFVAKEYPLLHYIAQTTRLAITRQEEERLLKCIDQLAAHAEVLFPKQDDRQQDLLCGIADFIKDSLAGKVIFKEE